MFHYLDQFFVLHKGTHFSNYLKCTSNLTIQTAYNFRPLAFRVLNKKKPQQLLAIAVF